MQNVLASIRETAVLNPRNLRARTPGIAAVMFLGMPLLFAQPVINELLINPPGSDGPNEYIELRGAPNSVFPEGSYLVVVEGDTSANPGTIDDVFELGGRALGGNGCLVLLQKGTPYAAHSNAAVLVNTGSGEGWGDGSSSSIGHRGNDDLENGSQTFLLIHTFARPKVGTDLDADDDGQPDHADWAAWTVWDSIGVMDADADVVYGAINFRINPAGIAGGTVVPVTFEQKYIGRTGNSTGSGPGDWGAGGGFGGTPGDYILGQPIWGLPLGGYLNHVGLPNFGAPEVAGVVARERDGGTVVAEGSGSETYELLLNTPSAGPVTLELESAGSVQISVDGGSTWGWHRTVVLSGTGVRTVVVRALEDNVVDTSPNRRPIQHTLVGTGDPVNYPLTLLPPRVTVAVEENDWVVLNELKVNPPGAEDAPYEFIELRGPPNARLQNVAVLVVNGDVEENPGVADVVVDLDGAVLGGSGLLVIAGPGHSYLIPGGTTEFLEAELGVGGRGLDNGSISFLLISSAGRVAGGEDLDVGDNGKLEGLPADATVLDAVGWRDGGTNDLVFAEVRLTQAAGTPDAATRFTFNLTPHDPAAWFNGDLAGEHGSALIYDSQTVSPNFPFGAILTPGIFANSPPSISPLAPYTDTIGDPTDPGVTFWVNDAETAPGDLVVTARSSRQEIVADGALAIVAGPGGRRTLRPEPIGVGYATITVTVDDGDEIAQTTMAYAASAMMRPGGVFHSGMSDASSALPLGSEYMLVADDERQTLYVYPRTHSGRWLRGFDLNPYLHLTDLYDDGTPREVDIEGSTRVGDRIYWMGAHSHARNAESRTNRGRIFATDITGTGTNIDLSFVGHYDFLKLDILAWDADNEHGKGANYYGLAASAVDGVDPKEPDGSGFNLEGFCMAPGSSNTAYLAFRAPLVPPGNRTKALILTVTNFDSLAISYGGAGSARFGPPIELDLNQHGIRSIEGNADGYMLVAGPPDVATDIPPKNFELYTWTGHAADPPQLRGGDLSRLIPEGIVELPPAPWTEATRVQVVTDSGVAVYYDDGLQAKFLTERNFKKFRSDWITLGPVILPAPTIQSLEWVGTGWRLTWAARAGHSYRVQASADLAAGLWADLPGEVTSTGATASLLVSPGSAPRFFRVICQPPEGGSP